MERPPVNQPQYVGETIIIGFDRPIHSKFPNQSLGELV